MAEVTPFGYFAALAAYTEAEAEAWRLRLVSYLAANQVATSTMSHAHAPSHAAEPGLPCTTRWPTFPSPACAAGVRGSTARCRPWRLYHSARVVVSAVGRCERGARRRPQRRGGERRGAVARARRLCVGRLRLWQRCRMLPSQPGVHAQYTRAGAGPHRCRPHVGHGCLTCVTCLIRSASLSPSRRPRLPHVRDDYELDELAELDSAIARAGGARSNASLSVSMPVANAPAAMSAEALVDEARLLALVSLTRQGGTLSSCYFGGCVRLRFHHETRRQSR